MGDCEMKKTVLIALALVASSCARQDEQRIGEVKRAFHENLVIFFRGQNLTEDQHKACLLYTSPSPRDRG